MRKLLAILGLLSLSSTVFAQAIVFDESVTTTSTKRLIVVEGGMSVNLGSIELARRHYNSSQGRVRIGSAVITSDNRNGTVTAMFVTENKIVVNNSLYGNRPWSTGDIAVTEGCVGPYCVNDQVITSDNRNGQIVGYFGDGQVVVNNSFYGNRTWRQDQVALAFGCTAESCVGDRVITSDNRDGRVSGFFGDGQVVVNNSFYGNRTWKKDQLALTSAVCTNIYIQRVHICP